MNWIRREYTMNEKLCEVERGTFTPLVFLCTGGICPAATVVYKRFATLISEKQAFTVLHTYMYRHIISTMLKVHQHIL